MDVTQTEKQKHLSIFDSMNGHEAALRRLTALVEKIEGAPQPCGESEKVEMTNQTLSQFLETGSGKMETMTKLLVEQINRLEQLLF